MEIYRSGTLKVFSSRDTGIGDGLLVACFQYRRSDQHLDVPGFSEGFFDRHGIDSVFINCATNEWWQYPDLPEAMAKLRDYSMAWKRTVTYGSSMGGYAALRFAATIGASDSVAVAPQYSPRLAVNACDNLYEYLVKSTEFLHEDRYRISNSVRNTVVYDPLTRPDASHVSKYEAEATIVHIKAFALGHPPTIPIDQCGLNTDLTLSLIHGTYRNPEFRARLRPKLRYSQEYWRQLASRCLERGRRDMALRIVRRSLDFVNSKDAVEFAATLAAQCGDLVLKAYVEQYKSFPPAL